MHFAHQTYSPSEIGQQFADLIVQWSRGIVESRQQYFSTNLCQFESLPIVQRQAIVINISNNSISERHHFREWITPSRSSLSY